MSGGEVITFSRELNTKFYGEFDDILASNISNLSFDLSVNSLDADRSLIKRCVHLNTNKMLINSSPQSYDNRATLLTNRYEQNKNNLTHEIESQGVLLQLFSRIISNTPSEKVQISHFSVKLDNA